MENTGDPLSLDEKSTLKALLVNMIIVAWLTRHYN
jgi:hypothetical protein